jgi:hypothetical protein
MPRPFVLEKQAQCVVMVARIGLGRVGGADDDVRDKPVWIGFPQSEVPAAR